MSLLIELLSGTLASEIAPYILNRDDVSIASILNRKDITVPGKLSVHDVKQYISLLGLRLPIMDSQTQSCREFNTALEDFKDSGFDLANPYIMSKIDSVLNALVAETLIPAFTAEQKAALLAFGNTIISRAEQININCSLSAISDALNGAV